MAHKGVKKVLRDADDILFLFTGKRFRNVTGRAVSLFGEEVVKKVGSWFNHPPESELPPDNPYSILGLQPDALDIVVKGSYRSLARELHPDTGTNPNSAQFQKVTEAYQKIMAERQKAKEAAQ